MMITTAGFEDHILVFGKRECLSWGQDTQEVASRMMTITITLFQVVSAHEVKFHATVESVLFAKPQTTMRYVLISDTCARLQAIKSGLGMALSLERPTITL